MSTTEERIAKLEDFQKRWKFYFWAVVIIAGLFCIFFGLKITQAKDYLETISTAHDQLGNELTSLNKKAKESESIAERAYRIAGDLEFAINEAKKSSLNAEAKSAEIALTYKEISKQVDKIKILSTEAKATAKVVESRLRQAEILLANLQTVKDKQLQQNEPLKPITVKLNGISMNIRFMEGPNPFENIEINQSGYRGNIFVPKGSSAKITGRVSGSSFIISKELKGRVVDTSSGINNTWVQDSEAKQYHFTSGPP